MLDVPPSTNNDSYPILQEEVEATVKSPKKSKSAGVDNIPTELVQGGREAMINVNSSSAIRYGRQESDQHLGLIP